MSSSKFELMCYYIVCRQKANKERLQKLRQFRKTDGYLKCYYSSVTNIVHPIKEAFRSKKVKNKEIKEYRKSASHMREVAKKHYSPLRRELKMKVYYDGSNGVNMITYDGQDFKYDHIKAIAAGYEFDEIVLKDKATIQNPYNRE